VRRLSLLVVAAAAVACAWSGAAVAQSFERSDAVVSMDDGVGIATTLYVPEGTPPPSGWPAVMMFHGLGGTRQDMNQIAESSLALDGYVVLTFDARGHGQSGGLVSIDGPRELQDVRNLFAGLTARPDVDAKHVGAFGISLGGGAVWRSAVEGVPWAAIEPVITWTDLYGALIPQNLSKSGAIASFLASIPPSRTAPELADAKRDLFASTNLAQIHTLTDLRSSSRELGSLRTPTFMLQGRRDFAFGIDQAVNAYVKLKGPKRLYLGDLGHSPAANPPAERSFYLIECKLWFDRFLKGEPNGIDRAAPVELAPDPWTGKTAKYWGLPGHVDLRLPFRGRKTIAAGGKVVRTVKLPRRRLEQLGAPVLRLTASSPTGWSHLVAVLTAIAPNGQQTVVSEGGTATTIGRTPRRVAIRMIDEATPIPAGSRLRLTLAATSLAQSQDNVLYFVGVAKGSRVTLGPATLTLPVLRKAVSR
jgi:predicted acyl esterase